MPACGVGETLFQGLVAAVFYHEAQFFRVHCLMDGGEVFGHVVVGVPRHEVGFFAQALLLYFRHVDE